MWITAMLSLVITAVALQFLPDSVPMHYNLAGEIDRWGSKYENLIFPAITLAMALFWQLFVSYYEKKAAGSHLKKDRAEAQTNAKVLAVTGVATTALFTAIQIFILYGAYAGAATAATHVHVDIVKVSCILSGAVMVILGNFMPKTRRNSVVGVRIRWSMYNDITWMKSNRFGAVAMMAAGFLTIVTAVFAQSTTAMILLLVYLLAATTVTLLYSHRVYREVLAKEGLE